MSLENTVKRALLRLEASKNSFFPKIIHQTWMDSELPERFLENAESWKKHHPDWEYRLWTDEDNRDFLEREYPWALPLYDNYSFPICKVDLVRYFYMYHFGGLYADLDFICFKPVDELLSSAFDVVLGHMGENTSFEHSVPNALMISKQKQEFWKYVFGCLVNRFYQIDELLTCRPEYITGPAFLKECVDNYHTTTFTSSALKKSNIKIMPNHIFYPIDWNSKSDAKAWDSMLKNNKLGDTKNFSIQQLAEQFPNSYALTYWAHTWG